MGASPAAGPTRTPDADLLWRDWRAADPDRLVGRGGLFLDRDGVIVVERHYLADPADAALERGIPALIQAARGRGMAIICVTNQAGIGRGRFDWDAFAAVESRIAALLRAADAELDAVLACPFHPAGEGSYRVADHPWRKPNPGMIQEAFARFALAPERSLLVGDKDSDILAARAAGLRGAVHVLTGHGADHRARALAAATPDFAVRTADTPEDAVGHLDMVGA